MFRWEIFSVMDSLNFETLKKQIFKKFQLNQYLAKSDKNYKTTIIEGGISHPYHTLLENGCPHQLKNTVTTITFFNEYLALKNIPICEF